MSKINITKNQRGITPEHTKKRCPKTGMFLPNNGVAKTPEYKVWIGMKTRCLVKTDPGYPRYGGRGITICDRWLDSFENFINDMGARPEGAYPSGRPLYSIERRDNNGNYEPDNCYWATRRKQQNNMRNNVALTHDGVTLNISQWARRTGISDGTIRQRIRH